MPRNMRSSRAPEHESLSVTQWHFAWPQFGAAITLAFLFMFFYQKIKEDGLKKTTYLWFKRLKEDHCFRKVFILAFYVAMILFRTLFCRSIFPNPLQNVLGIWGLYNTNGTLYTENIENFILFLPFTRCFSGQPRTNSFA